jgi:hypothetical protein
MISGEAMAVLRVKIMLADGWEPSLYFKRNSLDRRKT